MAIEQTAAVAGVAAGATGAGAGAVGIMAFMASGPTVSPEFFVFIAIAGGVSGGITSSLADPGALTARGIASIAGFGAASGGLITTLMFIASGFPMTMQALIVIAPFAGLLAWPVRLHLPKLFTLSTIKALLPPFMGGGQK